MRFPLRRRLITLAVVASAFASLLTAPAAQAAAPTGYRFSGGGYGHGVGMSQYGALGMALQGRSAAEMIGFYYGGARPVTVGLPDLIRVGLLEAQRDGVVVRGTQVAGSHPDAELWFRARARDGRFVSRGLPRDITYTLRPEAGGVSVFEGSVRRFGPSAPGSAIQVDYQHGVQEPSLLTLPQADRTLRWGYLEVAPVHDGTRARLRAVASMDWQHYLRGVAEVPTSWPQEVLRAQAIASRSYALSVVRAAGQHRGRGNWYGCDCAVRPDTRDQHYVGWANERGRTGAQWVAAVNSTGSQVIQHGSTLVKAFYHSSSGGHTATISSVWGGPDLPYYPSKPDPTDAAAGRNPNFRWVDDRATTAVTQALRDLGVGQVTSIRAAAADTSGRVRTAEIRGTRGTEQVPGTKLRTLLKLKSTKFTVTPTPAV